ncbi:MAG: flavodoxin family protein [Dehalococcoidia bacterium]
MEVLGICGSPRKGGNTELLLAEALASAASAGADTKLFTVFDKEIKPCDGCGACLRERDCHIQDDMQPLYTRLQAADGIIVASPVYFWSVTGQVKVILDRLYGYYRTGGLSNKVGGVVVVGGTQGHTEVRNLLYAFFAQNHMAIADFVSGFASRKGDIKRDRHAMAAAKLLGQKVVSIIQHQPRYPEGMRVPVSTIVRDQMEIPSSPAEGRF